MATKSNLISIKLSDAELAKLRRLADMTGETVSGILRQLLIETKPMKD